MRGWHRYKMVVDRCLPVGVRESERVLGPRANLGLGLSTFWRWRRWRVVPLCPWHHRWLLGWVRAMHGKLSLPSRLGGRGPGCLQLELEEEKQLKWLWGLGEDVAFERSLEQWRNRVLRG